MTDNNRQAARVLVVDDEIIIRQVIAAALSDENYRVTEADSGEKALEKLQTGHFDVVITDITMAKISGIDLLYKIKEISPETEVILITAYASIDTAEEAVAGKAYRYLRKPFDDIDDVITVVQEAIDSGRKKRKEQERIEDLVAQRNRLEKRLGQLGTMYSISHAISFPEDIPTMFKEIAVLLFQALRPDAIACYVEEKDTEKGGLFIALTRPFKEETVEHLIENIHAKIDGKQVEVEKIYLRKGPRVEKIEELIELTFPKRSVVEGMLYIAYSEPRKITEDQAQLLEVTTAQMAGAIGKLIELRKRERDRLLSLFEGMVDGVVLFRQNGSVNIANKAACALLESDFENLASVFSRLGIAQNLDKIQEGEWTLGKQIEITPDKIISVTILPLEIRWEAVAIMVLRDITEHSKMQYELEHTRRLSMIGELAAGVVHELNTPLTIILGYAQLIIDQQIGDGLKGDIKNILEEAQRCKKIVSNILELAPSKNRARAIVNLRELVEKVLELKKHGLRKAKVRTECNYPDEIIEAEADSGQIQQVLLNLIKNSQDAMEEQDSPKKLEITLRRFQNEAYIIIEDSGPGIPEKEMKQIFNPFFTTKPTGKGSGLGLSISHKIMREHHGRLRCKNGLKGGAVFTIELPVIDRG